MVVVDATRSQIKPHDYQKANQFYNHHFYKNQIGRCKKGQRPKNFNFNKAKEGPTLNSKLEFWRENSNNLTFDTLGICVPLKNVEK